MTVALWGVWIWADNVPVLDVYLPALVQFAFYYLIFSIVKMAVDFWKWKIENGIKFKAQVRYALPKQKTKKKKVQPQKVKVQKNPLHVLKDAEKK